jgi:nucleoside-diphosphate-sugar epimerase
VKDLLPKIKVHIDDLADAAKLAKLAGKIKPDIIFHLATYGAYPTQNDGDLCIDTNLRGTWNLLKATAKIDYELLVNTGSSSEYGFKRAPMKENDYLEPASYYAVTKSSQTLLSSYFARENKKPVVTLRPFSVYGPYEEKSRFIMTLMKSIYLRQKMDLVAPDISRDWIYMDDMVDAYLLIDKLKKYRGEVFNIGTGTQSSIKEVVLLATEVIGQSTEFAWGKMKNRKWDSSYWVADITKAKKYLKWGPKIDLRQGLLLTWNWLRENAGYYL